MTETPDRVRGGHGRYDRNPDVVARAAQAATLRAQSLTYQQIADRLGYSSKAKAWEAVQQVLADTVAEPAEAVRTFELEKLDALERRYLDIIERNTTAYDATAEVAREQEDGAPVYASEAELMRVTIAAQAGLLRVSESRRKFLGLDAPTKVDVGTTVTYRIDGVDMDALR